MLTTTFRKTRNILREWRFRACSRRELAMLGATDRHDLGYRLDVNAEIQKHFWQP